MKNKKSQAWTADIMIATSIVSIGLIIFFIYSINGPGNERESIEKLFYEGNKISETIFSEGYPETWDNETVVSIGILSDDKVDDRKLEYFYDLTVNNDSYKSSKIKFNTGYDYYLFFDENMDIKGTSVEGIGKPGIDKNNITARNLIKITRFIVYNNKAMNAYIYIWEE